MGDYLTGIVEKQKNGIPAGVVSICTANRFAIKSAMLSALKYDVPVLIEATANQVDQNGGYTGMTPARFAAFVQEIGKEINFPADRIILGGDHLGPLTKSSRNEDEAMSYAETLVMEYVRAGFVKIHLDTSMRLGSDPVDEPLQVITVAERGARLCKAAENAYAELSEKDSSCPKPLYIIGSEVPIPGGTQSAEESAEITSPEDCKDTYAAYKDIFKKHGLDDAFSRVIAIVVQTGVEFGDSDIFRYESDKAELLIEYGKKNLPVVFEGHSTDYQTEVSLSEMVRDGIAILKVGPALTFALREALFALEMIEQELYSGTEKKLSDLRGVLDNAMIENPVYWKNHYHGNAAEQRFARKFSLSDRARYYLSVPSVGDSVSLLIRNINDTEIPLPLLSQYLFREFDAAVKDEKKVSAEDLICMHIGFYLDNYYKAILPELQ